MKFNFSQNFMRIGAKMATPQHVIHKPPKINPKTRFFFSKIPRILNFCNKFLNPHIKPVILAGTKILGH